MDVLILHVLFYVDKWGEKVKFEESLNKREEKGMKPDTVVGTFQYNRNFGFVIPDD